MRMMCAGTQKGSDVIKKKGSAGDKSEALSKDLPN